MRIDKFLKVSRVIKRRSVAAEAASAGRIQIGGKEVKPSKEVKVGDIVTVSYGDRAVTIKVLVIDEKPSGKDTSYMYEILED